ncbi:MAG: DoxX family protein [Hymenobacteraceae bacterium]|nr:DoxX family protein [Hymenobacteraceae bacterium]MDX5394942.1 DoxX family protein [Hymenobacteraceae bacterium]MDX5510976.1 DoxX family protein [Hymenobacteraceae bacterium]
MKRLFSTSYNSTAQNAWLLVLRICVGAFMLTHGYPKFEKLMAGNTQFGDPFGLGEGVTLGLAVFAEFLCSVLLIIGLGTRIAALFLIATMLTAAFVVHSADPFGNKEMALLYLLIYITILIVGAGKYSVDYLISKSKKDRNTLYQ